MSILSDSRSFMESSGGGIAECKEKEPTLTTSVELVF